MLYLLFIKILYIRIFGHNQNSVGQKVSLPLEKNKNKNLPRTKGYPWINKFSNCFTIT